MTTRDICRDAGAAVEGRNGASPSRARPAQRPHRAVVDPPPGTSFAGNRRGDGS